MNGALRTTLGVAAGLMALFVLEPRARPRRVVSIVRRFFRAEDVVDQTVAAEVSALLRRKTPRASSIVIDVEHGCVVLRGDVLTEERGALVREIASIASVDSVVDLLTERPAGYAFVPGPALPTSERRPRRNALAALELAAGIALASAGLRRGGAGGRALGIVGVLFAAASVATAARPSRSETRGPLPIVEEISYGGMSLATP